MSKRTYLILAALTILGLVSLLVLKSYSLEIVHSVVQNAVIQKAPSEYSEQQIRNAFSGIYQEAINSNREAEYFEKLNVLSHRLEKVQILDWDEVDLILEELLKE